MKGDRGNFPDLRHKKVAKGISIFIEQKKDTRAEILRAAPEHWLFLIKPLYTNATQSLDGIRKNITSNLRLKTYRVKSSLPSNTAKA